MTDVISWRGSAPARAGREQAGRGARRDAGNGAHSRDESLGHQWPVTQLTRLGNPGPLAQAQAGRAGWHQIAGLVQRGCSPRLAVRIVR